MLGMYSKNAKSMSNGGYDYKEMFIKNATLAYQCHFANWRNFKSISQ